MKQLLFFIWVTVAFAAEAQERRRQSEFFAALDVNQFQTVGASISLHPLITPAFSIGAGIDVVQIRDNSYNYTPYYLDTRYFIRGKKLNFFLFVQGSPGSIGKYRQKAPFGNTILVERVNRSFLGMGSGITLGAQSAQVKPFIQAKFRRYQMLDRQLVPTSNVTSKYALDQYTVSVGINF